MMKSKITFLLLLAAFFGSSYAFGQGYDDDDIYYNPDKEKKATTKKNTNPANGVSGSTTVGDFPAADTYTPTNGQGLNMDIDAYNRRTIPDADSASIAGQDSYTPPFEYTRKIERFDNPRVVIENPDAEVAQYYYADPQSDINIYINTPGVYTSSFYSPYFYGSPYYYGSPWYWGTPRTWWYYNSWAYNPWAWDAYWGPSWGWSWSWGGYYPGHWHPSYGHHHRPTWANRPSGNTRPAYRPGTSTGRWHGGNNDSGSGYRRGNSRPAYNPVSNSRPSYSSPSNSGSRGSGYRSGRSGSSRSSSSPSYRSNSSGSSRSGSSPSYRSNSSGGSRGSYGGSYGGGSSRGGGGTGRGRH